VQEILKNLLELQEVDTRLNAVRARLAVIPKQIAEVEARVAAGRAELEKSKELHAATLKDRKRYELDVEQWKEKVRKYKDQAYQVKTNEAYKALQHEIELGEAEIAKSEDRLLEQMVSGEQYDRQVKAAEKAFKEIEESARAERARIEAEKAAAQKELAAHEAERAKVVAAVPDDLLDHYHRIAKKHGGVAIAEVRGEACAACGARIRPHVFEELRRKSGTELYHCEICTRILYYAGPPAQPAAQTAAAQTSDS
jgi:predicted  nucleic acid-binding Zn-ribbon protein